MVESPQKIKTNVDQRYYEKDYIPPVPNSSAAKPNTPQLTLAASHTGSHTFIALLFTLHRMHEHIFTIYGVVNNHTEQKIATFCAALIDQVTSSVNCRSAVT